MKPIAIALENTFDKNNCVMLRAESYHLMAWKIATTKLWRDVI